MTRAKFCQQSKVAFILFGTFGKKWRIADIAKAIDEKLFTLTQHRLCHFGLKIDPTSTQPSASTFAMATNLDIKSHKCCGKPFSEHAIDYKSLDKSLPYRRRDKIKTEIASLLLEPFLATKAQLSDPRPPDSAFPNFSTFPTPDHDQSTGPPVTGWDLASSPGACERSVHEAVPDPELAFPTEERVRQKEKEKARKAAGIEVKRRKLHVEEHYDDCGQDLSGLGPEAAIDAADFLITHSIADPEQLHLIRPTDERFNVTDLEDYYEEASALAVYFLKGSESTPDDWMQQRPNLRIATCVDEFLYISGQVNGDAYARDDLAEICGGAARVSVICTRRKLHTCANFDLLTGFDLNRPQDQQAVWHYLKQRAPIVILMAPTCTPFGPLSNFNRTMHPDTWRASYEQAAPHGRFCGEVALYQCQRRQTLMDDSCFGNEQPNPSRLYEEHPWPVVLQQPGVSMQAFHQCMTGQVGPTGLPAKKPTGLLASDEELRKAVAPFWCDGTHEHDHPAGPALSNLRLWTWALATALANAVAKI